MQCNRVFGCHVLPVLMTMVHEEPSASVGYVWDCRKSASYGKKFERKMVTFVLCIIKYRPKGDFTNAATVYHAI